MLKSWGSARRMDIKSLTLKSAMLLALATVRRVRSLILLSVKKGYYEFGESFVKFLPINLEKNSRQEHTAAPIMVLSFLDPALDPVIHIQEYVRQMRKIGKDRKFKWY